MARGSRAPGQRLLLSQYFCLKLMSDSLFISFIPRGREGEEGKGVMGRVQERFQTRGSCAPGPFHHPIFPSIPQSTFLSLSQQLIHPY